MEGLKTMMGWYGDGVGWGGWIVMTLSMVAFWALVALAWFAILRGSGGRWPVDGGAGRDLMQILDERFARGEINAEEYQIRKDVLRDPVR